MPEVNLSYTKCLRCGHKWLPRQKEVRICPKCKSPYWDKPRKGEETVAEERAQYETQKNKDFEDFIELLNVNGVNYCIVGAYAVGFYSEPRTTKDLDLFVGISDEDARGLYNALKEFGLDDPSLTLELIKTKGKVLRMGIPPNRIEVLNNIDGVDAKEVLSHKVEGMYGRIKTFFIGLEELIKNKKLTKDKPLRKNSNDAADYENLMRIKERKQGFGV